MSLEKFLFTESPLLYASAGATTDGTTNSQTVMSERDMIEYVPQVPNAFAYSAPAVMEPATRQLQVGIPPSIGTYNRLYAMAAFDGGSGPPAWGGTITFHRQAATKAVPLAFTDSLATPIAALAPQVIDNPFARNDLQPAAPASGDVLRVSVDVTPGLASATPVAVFILLCPGGKAAHPDFGNLLSRGQW